MSRAGFVRQAAALAVALMTMTLAPNHIGRADEIPPETGGFTTWYVPMPADTSLRGVELPAVRLRLPGDPGMVAVNYHALAYGGPLLGDNNTGSGRVVTKFRCMTGSGRMTVLGRGNARLNGRGAGADGRILDATGCVDFIEVDPRGKGKLRIDGGGELRQGFSVQPLALDPPCTPDENTACLQGGRFRVEVDWRTVPTEDNPAVEHPVNDEAAMFYFFDPDNVEALVKVVDGCASNGHWWVYAAAATVLDVTLKVTDTGSGETMTYTNQLGQHMPAVVDTDAFATCP